MSQVVSSKSSTQVARDELKTLMAMASTWRERLSMARFIATLYVSRLMPFDTYGWTVPVWLHGSRYEVGVRTSEIYVFDEVYRDRMYDRIDDYIPKPGWVVLDVGANIGVFTFLAAERGADVYAFEPNPDCFRRLQATRSSHDDRARVQLFETGISDRVGAGDLLVEAGGTTGGTTLDEASAPVPVVGSPTAVALTTLDTVTPDLGLDHVDLLKMDIEGAEIEALRGAEHTLTHTDRIIAEYHSKDLLREFHEILDRFGFVEDLRFVYYPEDLDNGVEEVGMLYASKRA